MSKNEPNKPKLRVVPEDENVERLRVGENDRPEKTDPRIARGREEGVERVARGIEVLRVDREIQKETKSIAPDVSDILPQNDTGVDSEDTWGGSPKSAPPVGWLVLAGLVVFGLALWAMVSLINVKPELEEQIEEKKGFEIDRIKEEREVKQTLAAMKDCARGYLTADSIDEKLGYVRHPERVRPLMEDYYSRHEMKTTAFRHFERIRSMGLDSQSFVLGQVELESGGTYHLLIEQLDDGSFKVDWESDVCYLPVDWDAYLRERPTEPVLMRVFAQADNFYAFEFRDESKFDCYHLTTRDFDGHLFGYVEKGSEVAMAIKRSISRNKETANRDDLSCTLILRFPEGSHAKNAVWIDDFVMPRWTYVKRPTEDGHAE